MKGYFKIKVKVRFTLGHMQGALSSVAPPILMHDVGLRAMG